ncbi:MAG TPA: hypothetical protein PKX41_14345 [Anaerolineaceae bacterium]|nr:hypothetical protein [Tenuifilaceae bacterium]HOH21634.1 hypothetical protein [Anaerolineaceae bacterium]HQP62383.1 hypothetical protein [Anaerolineaceae bacterium]
MESHPTSHIHRRRGPNLAHYLLDNPEIPIWQRNHYEHILRSETELQKIRQYIRNNPLQWQLDAENPQKGTP